MERRGEKRSGAEPGAGSRAVPRERCGAGRWDAIGAEPGDAEPLSRPPLPQAERLGSVRLGTAPI